MLKGKPGLLVRFFCVMGVITGMAVFASSVASAEDGAAATLQVSDCVKCHQQQPATISRNGGKHATAVDCLDCHREHLPSGTDTIPVCSNCHEGTPHFELDNCLSCHSDPHEPLGLNLAEDITGPCLTCHEQQGKEFEAFPSAHSQQSCTFCHDVHGKIPDCANCHEPHVDGQTTMDCLSCHAAHHPLQISYALTTPREFCSACHEEAGSLLEQTTTKHQAFTCAFCHRGVHPTVPQCQTCHGEPHSPRMHAKMPSCLECHMDPHNLAK